MVLGRCMPTRLGSSYCQKGWRFGYLCARGVAGTSPVRLLRAISKVPVVVGRALGMREREQPLVDALLSRHSLQCSVFGADHGRRAEYSSPMVMVRWTAVCVCLSVWPAAGAWMHEMHVRRAPLASTYCRHLPVAKARVWASRPQITHINVFYRLLERGGRT